MMLWEEDSVFTYSLLSYNESWFLNSLICFLCNITIRTQGRVKGSNGFTLVRQILLCSMDNFICVETNSWLWGSSYIQGTLGTQLLSIKTRTISMQSMLMLVDLGEYAPCIFWKNWCPEVEKIGVISGQTNYSSYTVW